jgi:predicted transcriptional regulator
VTSDDARAVLIAHRDARAVLHEAVRALSEAGVTRTEIAVISGLSREGVRKILARA